MSEHRESRREFFQKLASTTAVAAASSGLPAVSLASTTAAAAATSSTLPGGSLAAGEAACTTSSAVPSWKLLLSKPDHAVRTLIDVKATMRDGVKLSANIFLPATTARWPVILERCPYGGKDADWYVNRALYFAQRGYVYVIQDVRGRYDSEGHFQPWAQEINDGRDTLDWCGTQQWSNGNVGMMGMSYMGLVQWLAAPTGSPYLKTIIPQACSADFYMYGMNYTGGAAMHYINLPWAMNNSARSRQSALPYDWDKLLRVLPILTADELATGRAVDFYHEWMEHTGYDDYWKKVSNFGKYSRMDMPILQICGWFDCHTRSTIANYEGIQREGTERTIRLQKVVMGPWIHTDMPEQKYGDVDSGPQSVIDMYELRLRWMDRWLKGISNGIESEPPLKLFTIGVNRWRSAEKWPLPQTIWTKFYLHSGGRANSLLGDGRLTREPPGENEAPDRFTYDPNDPVPTLGSSPNGQILPVDQRPVQRRDDVLVYVTDPLDEDLEVTGPMQAYLYASSSALDTDFTVKIVDVYPEGKAINVFDGIIRARFREPHAIRTCVPAPGQYEHPKLLKPGKVYPLMVELGVISIVFQRGHRIGIEVSSSNFPHYDRNLNSGDRLAGDDRIVVAKQTIYHSRQYPSHVELPVIPPGT